MMGRTHALTGLAAGLAVSAVTGSIDTTPVLAYGVAASAALMPDLDQHRSLASRAVYNKPIHMVMRHFRHRRFTHSLLGIGVFAVLFGLVYLGLNALVGLDISLFTMAVVGFVSHLVADAFNKQGIHLFYPFIPFGIEWVSVPLPKSLRISTIYDPKGPPITLGRLQAYIPTELLFFKVPVYLVIAFVLWHHAESLVGAARTDVWSIVHSLPGPLAGPLSGILQ